VDGIVRLVDGAGAPHVVNVCSGVPTTLLNACSLIARAMKVRVDTEVVGGYRAGDMRHCLGDATEFATLIGRPPLSFERGVGYVFGSR
jgi:hypothetical protein